MTLRREPQVPPLGISPQESGPFFSAEYAMGGEWQEHHIFRRGQMEAWMRVNAKQMRGQPVGTGDLRAIEPVATLILPVDESEFETKLLINTNPIPRQGTETLLEVAGEAFLPPLDRDGTLLVYYTETPANYE